MITAKFLQYPSSSQLGKYHRFKLYACVYILTQLLSCTLTLTFRPRNKTYIMTTILEPPYMMYRNPDPNEPEPVGNDRFEGYCKDFADMIAAKSNITFEIR